MPQATKPKKPLTVQSIKRKKLATVAGVFVAMLLVLFIARGFVRKTLLPTLVKRTTGNQANDVFISESNKLGAPLPELGFTNFAVVHKDCFLVVANGFSTQVDCTHNITATEEIAALSNNTNHLIGNAQKLQALLKANDWQGDFSQNGQNSLVGLMTDLTKGIDYHPDANFTKEINGTQCTFSNNTAFAKPDKPALTSRFWCTKSYYILGKPSWD